MKRIAVILLMFFYLISVIGVTASIHHCGGKTTSISLKFLDFRHRCSCGKKSMKKDCCKDEAKTLKLKDEQQKSHSLAIEVFKALTHQPDLTDSFDFSSQQLLVLRRGSNYEHPPNILKSPLYIRNRVILI